MRRPEDLLILLDLEVCADKLAREIAVGFDVEKAHGLLDDVLKLMDEYGIDRLRSDAPSFMNEAGALALEVAMNDMRLALANLI